MAFLFINYFDKKNNLSMKSVKNHIKVHKFIYSSDRNIIFHFSDLSAMTIIIII